MIKSLFVKSMILSVIAVSFIFFSKTDVKAGLSKRKVLSDFKRTYIKMKDRKIMKIVYLGKPRNFSRIEGYRRVYYHARKVALYNLFKKCGLKVKYTWEVWYRKSGRKLRFAQIAIWSHKFLNKPPKKLPKLDNDTIKKLINKKFKDRSGYQTYKSKAVQISIKKMKGKYNFCTPVYEVKSKVKILAGEEHKNIADVWSCDMSTNIQKKKGKWEVFSSDCLYRGKKQSCSYKKMCKKLGTKSKVDTITWEKAKNLIQDYLKKDARYKITKFVKFKFIRQEETSKSGLSTWFVVHAITDNLVPKNSGNHSVDYSYKYECILYFKLGFQSYGSKKWEVDNSECCSSKDKKCYSGSCRDYRKCKLVKKTPLGKEPSIVPENKTSDVVDCRNKLYKLKSSPNSLLSWARNSHKSLIRNGKDPYACEKTLKYEGSAYCQDKNNKKTIKLLKETISICK